ncbi:B-cell CLL/lymphoma 7 protein family member B isoform X2 [Anas acuta]|uniref:B-cell CLL/lymphoma 7 protein family member B isoform X2 n=1 Tax=Anas acuta TaxID=28680 RepID=UPI0035C8AB39
MGEEVGDGGRHLAAHLQVGAGGRQQGGERRPAAAPPPLSSRCPRPCRPRRSRPGRALPPPPPHPASSLAPGGRPRAAGTGRERAWGAASAGRVPQPGPVASPCAFLSFLKKEKSKSSSSSAREPNGFPADTSANSSLLLEFQDENSNQSSLSDVYQLKVDSSPNSSPSPQQSESMSPAHTSDFRTDDSQPPTLGQETLEEPSLPSSEVADEPPTLTKEEPVPLETQVTEEEEDSGAPPLKRFCADQNSVCHTASES